MSVDTFLFGSDISRTLLPSSEDSSIVAVWWLSVPLLVGLCTPTLLINLCFRFAFLGFLDLDSDFLPFVDDFVLISSGPDFGLKTMLFLRFLGSDVVTDFFDDRDASLCDEFDLLDKLYTPD